MLDSTNPDLSAFQKRGGKMIVTIGTNDTLASPGAQLDYYQSVIDKMGRAAVDQFARFFVLPQTGHGLSGTSYERQRRRARRSRTVPIPNRFDQLGCCSTGWRRASRQACRSPSRQANEACRCAHTRRIRASAAAIRTWRARTRARSDATNSPSSPLDSVLHSWR